MLVGRVRPFNSCCQPSLLSSCMAGAVKFGFVVALGFIITVILSLCSVVLVNTSFGKPLAPGGLQDGLFI